VSTPILDRENRPSTARPVPSELFPGVVIVCPADAPEDVWLRERLNGIGGSDVAAAVGISRYSSPYRVWAEKTGRSDPEPDEASRERMLWGHLLEPVIRAEFARRHPEFIVVPGEGTYARVGALWQRVNVDGLVFDRKTGALLGVLEIKTGTHWQLDAWEGEEIPVSYTAQGQWANWVLGEEAQRTFYAALLDTSTYVEKVNPRDDELIADLVDLASDLWRHVEDDTLPPIDGSAATTETLRRIKALVGERVDLDPSWRKGVARRDELSEEIKALKKERDEIDNQLREAMGTATEAYLDGEPVFTNRPTAGGRSTDYDGFQLAAPDLYEQFVTVGEPGRTLRRKTTKKKNTRTTTTTQAAGENAA